MVAEQTLSNILSIIILLGGPILPLLFLVTEVGRWYARNQDPVEIEQAENHGHGH